jgi:hypothetical protein
VVPTVVPTYLPLKRISLRRRTSKTGKTVGREATDKNSPEVGPQGRALGDVGYW